MSRLRRALRRRRGIMPLDRSKHTRGRDRPLDNTDAQTGVHFGDHERNQAGDGLPPSGWVKDYDDGRPRT